jgi:hypothetical protein
MNTTLSSGQIAEHLLDLLPLRGVLDEQHLRLAMAHDVSDLAR